jgi:hypothetical protein
MEKNSIGENEIGAASFLLLDTPETDLSTCGNLCHHNKNEV